MAVRDDLLGIAEQCANLVCGQRLPRFREELLHREMAGAGNPALTRIARVAVLPPELFLGPDVEDQQHSVVEAVEAIRDREDSTEVARSLDGRARFVVGEFDPFVSAQELAAFDVREIAETGHLVNLERPEVFNFVLREFLDHV